jgi:hypothetical protein
VRPQDDEDRIALGLEDDEEDPEDFVDDDGFHAPGPDERDRDLMDGSWEQRYYSGREGTRDWSNIGLAIAIVVILAMVLPGILVFAQ